MTKHYASFRRFLIAACLALTALGAPAFAHSEKMNCVQFMLKVAPVTLRGDAYEWWDSADGLYGRGKQPAPGSVMVFAKSRRLPHGHVALVQQQLDSRTILIDHANWSRIGGSRGKVERAVRVIDVSERNDWSAVRVWYQSVADVGQTVYPLRGFVYPLTAYHPRLIAFK